MKIFFIIFVCCFGGSFTEIIPLPAETKPHVQEERINVTEFYHFRTVNQIIDVSVNVTGD